MSIQIKQTLTSYARNISQDRTKALASFIAPRVVVGASSGQYKEFNSANDFQVYQTLRPTGGAATRIQFLGSDKEFSCKAHSLEIAIDDKEREDAGDGDPLGLEQAKTRTLVNSAYVAHEKRVVDEVNKIAAASNVGVWSDHDVDPIDELDQLIETISTNCGMLVNALAISLGVFRILRSHPAVLARQPGAALIGVTTQQLAAMTLNPSLDIRVGVLAYNTAGLGAAEQKQNLFGNQALLFIRSETPDQFDPSFMKEFSSSDSSIESVGTYRDDPHHSDVLALNWSSDIKVTSSIAGARIVVS